MSEPIHHKEYLVRARKRVLTLVLFFACCVGVSAQTADGGIQNEALLDEPFLHPVDGITPFVLRQNEFIYAQSIQTLPFPSWGFWGVTDNLTVQLDFLPWIFGVFSELGKPIPSLNARYQFIAQDGWLPAIGLEAMFVYFWEGLDRFATSNISVRQAGAYSHVKPVIGYEIGERLLLALSVGVDYTEHTEFTNVVTGAKAALNQSLTPNGSASISFRASRWASLHAAYTYGATLTYLENVPVKHQVTYGARLAPFLWIDLGFFNTMRIELTAINSYFPAVDAWESFPLPIFPYFYWQWRL
jgi:hypothetical protein